MGIDDKMDGTAERAKRATAIGLSSPDEEEESDEAEATTEAESPPETEGVDAEPEHIEVEVDADDSETPNTSETSVEPDTGGVSEAEGETEEGSKSLTEENKNLNIYIPHDLADRVDEAFEDLRYEHRKVHGSTIEKNRDFYPVLFEEGLDMEALRERLGIPADGP